MGVGAVLLAAATGAGQLPPEVQADAYLLEVEQAIGDGNYDRAWDRLQDIVGLQTENDLELPEFPFWYAKAAEAMNMPEQALASVTEYLTAAGREAVHYSEALALLNALQAAVKCQGWDADAYFETATPEQVTACLETGTVDLDAHDASGLTPLHAAAAHAADPTVVEALLDAGAQVEATDTVSGATPLSLAIRDNGMPAIIEVLLAGGSNPEAPDKTGLTPLHLAALHTDDPVVYEILLTARSGLTTPEQVLEAAERSIEILIENGATPIHLEQALEEAGLDVSTGVRAQASTRGVQAPVARPVESAYLTLNLSWLDAERAFIENSSMGLYGETANFDTLYSSSADQLPGAFLGVRAWKDLSVAIGVTRFRTATDVNLRGTVPHPLFFGYAREVDQQLAGFEHQQVGIHLQLVWMRRINESVDVAFSAGPSLFLVTQDRVTGIAVGDEVAPYGEVMVTAGREAVETRAFGANTGIDLTVNVARHLGLAIFVRWTEGRADFPELGPAEKIRAGGVQSGLGLHFRF